MIDKYGNDLDYWYYCPICASSYLPSFNTCPTHKKITLVKSQHPRQYYKVLLSVEIGNTDFKNQIYQWITSPVSMRMDDYRECAEMVIKYAKNENWNNDYYLYVNTRNILGIL